MSIGILNDDNKRRLNNERLAGASFVGARMRLAGVGALPITHATTPAALISAEMTFPGYLPKLLTGWTPSILTADFHAISYADVLQFDNTGLVVTPLIYAWWYHDEAHDAIIIAGRFANPFAIDPGSYYTIVPSFRLTGE